MKKKKEVLTKAWLIIIILFLIQLYIDGNILEISSYNIYSDKIGESFNNTIIIQLSDLHSKEFGENNINLISKIDDIAPDFIVMTGDMVSSKDTNFNVFLELAKELASKYDCYYIVGNHEPDLPNNDYNYIMNSLDSYGIDVLDNEKVELIKGNDKINLYGLWYNVKFYFDTDLLNVGHIEKILGEDSDDTFDLLLTHNPIYFDVYNEWGADLTLSGHVHGGMIRLPIVGPLFAAERTLFPKYSQGEYKSENASMIVSRGLGNGNNGFRLFNRPEINVITLKSK